jgi:hypothetical protein
VITLTAVAGYLLAALFAARRLYQTWRPEGVPVCGREETSGGYLAPDPTRYTEPHQHGSECRRRRRHGASPWPLDSPSEAAVVALLTGLTWPGLLVYLSVTTHAPETVAEKKARLADLERDVATAEAELLNLQRAQAAEAVRRLPPL